jgi:hypothetical protein
MKFVSLLLASLLIFEGAALAGQSTPATESRQVPAQETPQVTKIKTKV